MQIYLLDRYAIVRINGEYFLQQVDVLLLYILFRCNNICLPTTIAVTWSSYRCLMRVAFRHQTHTVITRLSITHRWYNLTPMCRLVNQFLFGISSMGSCRLLCRRMTWHGFAGLLKLGARWVMGIGGVWLGYWWKLITWLLWDGCLCKAYCLVKVDYLHIACASERDVWWLSYHLIPYLPYTSILYLTIYNNHLPLYLDVPHSIVSNTSILIQVQTAHNLKRSSRHFGLRCSSHSINFLSCMARTSNKLSLRLWLCKWQILECLFYYMKKHLCFRLCKILTERCRLASLPFFFK